MKWLVFAFTCTLISGCSTLQSSNMADKALDHLEYCERTYTGGIGAGATLGVSIHCEPRPFPVNTPVD
jgi:uncharacterized protein YceK